MAKKFEIDENNHLVQYNGTEKNVKVPEGVTAIGERAFYFSDIVSVTLPESCTVIGEGAFGYCSELKSLVIKGPLTTIDDYALNGCHVLEDFVLPETLTTIGESSISVGALKALHIPKSLVNVGTDPFVGNQDGNILEEVTVDEDSPVFSAEDGVLYNKDKTVLCIYPHKKPIEHLVIKDTVEIIEKKAFLKKEDLKTVVFPSSLREIKENAFYGCKNLEKISFENGITTIGNSAFQWNEGIKDIGKLPDTLKVIEGYAFFNCSSIKEINIPAGIEKIGNEAFGQCFSLENVILEEGIKKIDFLINLRALKSLYIPASVTEIKDLSSAEYFEVAKENPVFSSENGVLYNKDKTVLIKYAGSKNETTYEAPSTVKVIREKAFQSNETLERVILPEGVERIEREAFANTDKIKEIKLPSTLKFIGTNAFSYCKALEYLDIPNSTEIETIESHGSLRGDHFSRCKSLKRVTLPDTLKCVVGFMFSDCEALEEIKLPKATEKIYSWAFGFCKALKKIEIPPSCKEIDERSFCQCVSLKNVVIPSSVEKIGEEAFSSIKGLTLYGKIGSYAEKYAKRERIPFKAILDGDVKTIGDFQTQGSTIIKYLGNETDIEIPKDVTAIADNAFCDVKLTRVVIHKDVTRIDKEAFGKNKGIVIIGEEGSYAEKFARSRKIKFLTPYKESALNTLPEFEIKDGTLIAYNGESRDITIPNEVTKIADGAFTLYSINELTLGTNVREIGKKAFVSGCKIKTVYYDGRYEDIPENEKGVRDFLLNKNTRIREKSGSYRGIIEKKIFHKRIFGMDKRLIVPSRLSMSYGEFLSIVNEMKTKSDDDFGTFVSFENGKEHFIFETSYKTFDKDIINALVENKITVAFDDIIISFNPYTNVKLTDFNIGSAERVELIEQQLDNGVLKEREEGPFCGVDIIPADTIKIEPSYFDTVRGWIAEYDGSISNWLKIEGQENIASFVDEAIVRCKDGIVQYVLISHERPSDRQMPYYAYAHLGYKYRIRAAKAGGKGDYWDFVYSAQASVLESGMFMKTHGWCEENGEYKDYSVYDFTNFLRTQFDVEAG